MTTEDRQGLLKFNLYPILCLGPENNDTVTLLTVRNLTSQQCRFISLNLSPQDNKNIIFLDIVTMFGEFISFYVLISIYTFYWSIVDL